MSAFSGNTQREAVCAPHEYRGRVIFGVIVLVLAGTFLFVGGQSLVDPMIEKTIIGGVDSLRFMVGVGIYYHVCALCLPMRAIRVTAPLMASAVTALVVLSCF